MALMGIVKKWHGDKGFGFIEPRDGNEDIFCHVSDLLDGEGSIMEGDEVRYSEKYDDRKGKYRATEVELDRRSGGGGGGGGRSGRGRRDDVSRSPPPRGGKRDSDTGGMKTGVLLRWNAEKGFGFIQPSDGTEDMFCHVSALIDGEGSVTDGDNVTYFKEFNDRKGKYQAVDVQRARGGGRRGGGDRDRSRSPRGDRRDERSRDVRDYGGRDRNERGGRDGDRDRRGAGRECSRRDDRRESDRRDYDAGGGDFDGDKGRSGRGRDYDRGSGRDYDRDGGRGRSGGREYVRSSRY